MPEAEAVAADPLLDARVVTCGADLEIIRALFREYAEWVAVDLSFQGFAAELAGLPGQYVAPGGVLVLATSNGVPAGCIAVRRWDADACEMKRLYARATSAGNVAAIKDLLVADAVLITDGGPEGRAFRGIRNLRRPLEGAKQVAAFVAATARRAEMAVEQHELNGQPALVFYRDDQPFAAVLLAVAEGMIQRIFFHADPNRLRHLGRGLRHLSEGGVGANDTPSPYIGGRIGLICSPGSGHCCDRRSQ